MGQYQGDKNFQENVYLFELTDAVRGGPDGKDNLPLKQLADRTMWLKNAIRGFNDLTLISSSKTLSLDEILQKIVVINSNIASIECTLPELNHTAFGVVASIRIVNATKQVTIKSQTANIIFTGEARSSIYLGDAEYLQMVWSGSQWLILTHDSNLANVGQTLYSYSQHANTVVANGQLLLRSDYPRLFEFINTLPGSLVSDFAWNNQPNNKGFFSTGNGSTNFRVPDLRGMFFRALDLGAGVDIDRFGSNPGAYEADEIKEHTHSQDLPNTEGKGKQYETNRLRDDNDRGLWYGANQIPTGKTGGLETRPKNIGLIPLIKV